MSITIDSTISALLGVAIGGAIGVIGTVITAWATSRRERRAFLRSVSQQHVERVRSTYEHALMVLFNHDGTPSRETRGNLFAQVSLFGSKEVNELVNAYLTQPRQNREIDLPKFIDAMKKHLDALEDASLRDRF